MKLVSFVESKLAKFYEEGVRKLMARWEDVVSDFGRPFTSAERQNLRWCLRNFPVESSELTLHMSWLCECTNRRSAFSRYYGEP
ncbi:hypothetical protein ACTXT7_001460 [Hymenolepis weldensis]